MPNRCKVLLLSLIAVTFCFVSSPTFGQVNNVSPKLDSLMDKLSSKNKFMGSLTISKNNHILFNKAYGYASIAQKPKESKLATTKTKYRIGSITKMFTSTMIFQLIEEKKLTLDTKLSAFFPEIPNAASITINNLLNHRSGISNITNDSTYGDWQTIHQSEKEMVNRIKSLGSVFTPNEKAEYSNSNYILLGYIIEHLTGKSYKKNLHERIADKIGLKNTYYGGKTEVDENESYSYGYDGTKWVQEPETDMSIPGGAGGIVSTTKDLCSFITALFQEKLIHKPSLDSMTTLVQRYGRGVIRIPFGERSSYGHTGGIDKFVSILSYFPDDSVAIAFCNNGLDYNMNDIAIGILSIYFNKPYEIPSLVEVHVEPSLLKSYQGVYSSTELPIKLTVKVEGSKLTAQGTGQSPFPLEAVNDTDFVFTQGKIKISFVKNGLRLNQGAKDYIMTRE
jgi:D-alanyl-D-alanine carboxypeptidase